MQTIFPEELANSSSGKEAYRILRSCVHCGFCTATCPTYRLMGDELDSPRGRIYLIKGLLEGKESSQKTMLHLDRCLTCLSCETHCPSGVEYGHLLDIGRQKIAAKIKRPYKDRLFRFLLRKILPYPKRFALLLGTGRFFRPILAGNLKKMIPLKNKITSINQPRNSSRQMILFSGCVQPAVMPSINAATIKILDKLGINTVSVDGETCCGAIDYHMAEIKSAEKFIKRNIDIWWPAIENDTETIISTASGCGAMIKDYGYILRDDPEYADKAAHISSITKDIAEVVSQEEVTKLESNIMPLSGKLAFHNPCTLQHGQNLKQITEDLLERLGFNLTTVPDSHVCCGSAGVYSLLQSGISQQLKNEKICALESGHPATIATANIGCLLHLQQATELPVKHWIELLAEYSRD